MSSGGTLGGAMTSPADALGSAEAFAFAPSGAADRADAPTDADLMVGVREGNEEAFRLIMSRHKDALVSYLARMVACRDRAEDLAQETFVRLYRHAARYRERGYLRAYLFRIATNLVRSEERRRARWRALTPRLMASEAPPEPSPRARLMSGEATGEVTRALHALPAPYRAPLVLRELEGWSYAEIAAALRCREGTVKSRIHRAKKELRALLESYWSATEPEP